MDAEEVKNVILNDDSVLDKILKDLGMQHIKLHTGYYTFGLPDGDNLASTTLYLDNLSVKAYTRENIKDIIDLVIYAQRINKTVENPNCWTAVVWLCEELQIEIDNYSKKHKLNTYSNPFVKLKEDISNVMKLHRSETFDNLQPELSNDVLVGYLDWNNTEFLKDNISYETQTEFKLGIDISSHRITIPIYDELSRLVGVKGRRVWDIVDENNPKYLYLKQCEKNKLLYGLDKTLLHIKEKDEVIICESEKGVMQLWSYGVKNAVGIGCHSISKVQKEKIIRMNISNIVIALDKDVSISELLQEYKKLFNFANVYCIVDVDNLLDKKESPMDNQSNWSNLYKNYKYKFNLETGGLIKWYSLKN